MKDRLAKSIFWIVWSRGVVQIISFLSTILVARLLTPEDYGLMALASVWTNTMGLISEMGMGAAIIQFRDLDTRELNTCFWSTVSVALLGYLALYVAAPAIALWFASPALAKILRVVGLVLPLMAIRVVPDSLLRKRLQLDKVSQADIIAAMVAIPVVISLAWIGAGVWALVAGTLVTPLIRSVVVFWFIWWWPGFQCGGKRVKEVLRFSLAILGGRICWSIYQQADTIVLGKVAGQVAVGFYSMARELATLPVSKVSAVINELSFPMMAELQGNLEALRASLLRGMRLVAWVTFPLCAGLALVAEDLVRVVLSEKWISAVPILQLLCLYAAVKSLDVLLPPVLTARFRIKFLVSYTVMLLVVMSLAFWAGAVWWGAIGVAAAWVVVYPLCMATMAHETLREIGMPWKTLWRQLWPPLAATFFMVATVLIARWGISWWEKDLAVGRLAVLSVTGAAAYGVALLGLGGAIRGEIQEIAGWVVRGSRGITVVQSKAG